MKIDKGKVIRGTVLLNYIITFLLFITGEVLVAVGLFSLTFLVTQKWNKIQILKK